MLITRSCNYRVSEKYKKSVGELQQQTLEKLYIEIGRHINDGKTYKVSIISSETTSTESDKIVFDAIADITETSSDISIY